MLDYAENQVGYADGWGGVRLCNDRNRPFVLFASLREVELGGGIPFRPYL